MTEVLKIPVQQKSEDKFEQSQLPLVAAGAGLGTICGQEFIRRTKKSKESVSVWEN